MESTSFSVELDLDPNFLRRFKTPLLSELVGVNLFKKMRPDTNTKVVMSIDINFL
jgi:hypothetical protein